GLTRIFTVHTGFFCALTAQHFRIDEAFTTDSTVIGLSRCVVSWGTRHRAPWRGITLEIIPRAVVAFAIVTLTVITFAVITAGISVIAGGATATVCTRRCWTPCTLSGTRINGAFVRIIITADIHHFDLAAFIFQFIVHAFLHQRCAKRADYPMCKRIAIISYKSL